MAAVITTRIMEDGPRNAVLLINGTEAAGSAPGPNQVIILPTQLGFVDITRQQRCASLRVDTIEWDIQAEASYQVNLFWNATADVQFYSCIGRANKYFKNFGGLYQQAGIAGSTGGISLNTANPAGTGPTFEFTLVLYLIKNGLNPA
jgi:hypothetical protein